MLRVKPLMKSTPWLVESPVELGDFPWLLTFCTFFFCAAACLPAALALGGSFPDEDLDLEELDLATGLTSVILTLEGGLVERRLRTGVRVGLVTLVAATLGLGVGVGVLDLPFGVAFFAVAFLTG